VEFTSDGLPRDGLLRLRDGRALAYREWGDPVGAPVVFAHGTPASRVWCPDPHQDATQASAVRLITVDRPGIGGSDVQLGLTVGGWASDVAELADGLGLERFGVVGLSAGGPWAAACAALIPERLTGVETVGHCVGTAGDGGTLEMQVTSFRATGNAAQLTFTEWITVGDISFTAEMKGHASPAGFIVLNGTVTEGSFAGAQVHQRSNLVGIDGTTTAWTGELQLLPASA
jgi:pimeloyl-ACP methyl ester carboxylesterase